MRHMYARFTQRLTRVLFAIGVILAGSCLACQVATQTPRPRPLTLSVDAPALPRPVVVLPAAYAPPTAPAGLCERPSASGRERRDWGAEDRKRTRQIADLVTKEMGANRAARRLVTLWSKREGNHNPAVIHVQPEDIAAATSKRSRALLADHPLRDAQVRTAEGDLAWAWGYGRGQYGMQPAHYAPRWDPDAGPWVLCDPIIATVTAVWAARDHADECAARDYPRTAIVSNRRWGTGHCTPRSKDAGIRAAWERRGVDPDARIKWGRKWPEDSDREIVYSHMERLAIEAGLK